MDRNHPQTGKKLRAGRAALTSVLTAGLLVSTLLPAHASDLATTPNPPTEAVSVSSALSQYLPAGTGWQRTNLIYHSDQRTDKQWRQNIVGVQANGNLGTTQLFDSYILTVDKLDGKDIVYNQMTKAEVLRLLDVQFADAAKLNVAAKATGKTVQIGLSIPWIHNNEWFEIPGYGWVSTTNADDRNRIMTWYIDETVKRATAAKWTNTKLTGMFYSREDIINSRGDDKLVQHMNKILDSKNLTSVWVPYYDAPNAFTGQNLGFDRVTVQPSYSFKNREDGGKVDASRIYVAAAQATGTQTGIEYEIRGQGDTATATAVAHQYLAIGQETGLSKKPHVFFTGIEQNIFDRMGSQVTTPASRWTAYTDLTAYLRGQKLNSLDNKVAWTPSGAVTQTKVVPLNGLKATTVRMDFKDAGVTEAKRWNGKVTVKAYNASGSVLGASYTVASGPHDIDGLNRSVLVPVPESAQATKLEISVTPFVSNTANLVSPKVYFSDYELYDTSASTDRVIFTSSNDETSTSFSDIPATSSGFARGKLTDGLQSSDKTWWGDNANRIVGWSLVDADVVIDLGKEYSLSSFAMGTFQDANAGVAWPQNVVATASNCAQGATGTVLAVCDTKGAALGNPGTRALAPGQGTARYDTVTGKFNTGAKSRYVTVSLTAAGWALLDEIEIYDIAGNNIAKGATYTLPSPPRNQNGSGYKNNGVKLSDGSIPSVFVPSLSTGFERNKNQWLSAKYADGVTVNGAKVWLVQDNSWGISIPQKVTYSWTDTKGITYYGGAVKPTLEKGKYVLNINLLNKNAKSVTVSFPVEAGGWTMVSEMTFY